MKDFSEISARAIELAGGGAAVARALGISPAAVTQWVNKHRRIPPARCRDIEELSGIPRRELRPDIFGDG